jgi:endonuclease-3
MVRPRAEPRAAWLARETAGEKKARAATIYERLSRAYPDAKCALEFSNPLEMLIATVLSAQSTDAMVNKVTRTLFQKYRRPEDYLAAPPGELERDIRSTGFFNQKAKAIRGICRMLVEEHGGRVPDTMEELVRLPGVARKTANIVLGNAFGKVEGIAVDTHVHRLARRLGLSDEDDPNKVERDLMALFPRSRWFRLTYLLIEHGRAVCKAPTPRCEECVVADLCPSSRLPASRAPGPRTRGSRAPGSRAPARKR